MTGAVRMMGARHGAESAGGAHFRRDALPSCGLAVQGIVERLKRGHGDFWWNGHGHGPGTDMPVHEKRIQANRSFAVRQRPCKSGLLFGAGGKGRNRGTEREPSGGVGCAQHIRGESGVPPAPEMSHMHSSCAAVVDSTLSSSKKRQLVTGAVRPSSCPMHVSKVGQVEPRTSAAAPTRGGRPKMHRDSSADACGAGSGHGVRRRVGMRDPAQRWKVRG